MGEVVRCGSTAQRIRCRERYILLLYAAMPDGEILHTRRWREWLWIRGTKSLLHAVIDFGHYALCRTIFMSYWNCVVKTRTLRRVPELRRLTQGQALHRKNV
jgi:hypothetical protein